MFLYDDSVIANLDVYLSMILTLLLGAVVYLRRSYDRQMEQLQTEIDNLETFLQQINTTGGNEDSNGGGGGSNISNATTSNSAITSDQRRENLEPTTTTNSVSSSSINAQTSSSNSAGTSSATSSTRLRSMASSLDRAAIASTADPIE